MKNFGDIVLFDGNDLYSKIIKHFTKSDYVHSAIRSHRNTSRTVSRKGKEFISLVNPSDDITKYLILEHEDIQNYHRNEMRKIDKFLEYDYDLLGVGMLALKHLIDFNDELDISRPGKFQCASRIARLYELVDLDWWPSQLEPMHFSQAQPHYFLNENFNITGKWERKNKGSEQSELFK